MRKCSRCKSIKPLKCYKNDNSTCKDCIIKVTNWNINNKSRYNANKFRSYYNNQYEVLKRLRNRRQEQGWKISYHGAKQRCNNPKNPNYKYYGARGIMVLMDMKDFKKLWFRDKAYNMKIPSINRKENNGNYEYNNCRFIEKSENTMKRNYERAGIC